jgi:hypothetical protein
MERIPQPEGRKGSLKWIQLAVNTRPAVLDNALLEHLRPATSIRWLSPLADDEFAEYRDSGFLEKIHCIQLETALERFWPGT